MKKFTLLFLLLTTVIIVKAQSDSLNHQKVMPKDKIPAFMLGDFKDDYGSSFTINDTLWIQHPKSKYHIIKCNTEQQYLIAKNDEKNKGEAGLYTRIDYVQFSNMAPYTWGFCLSIYDAKNETVAAISALVP